MRSKRTMASRLRSKSTLRLAFATRSMMGAVYHDPKRMPMCPFGGRARQKRHMGGRSRSSSLGSPKARVWM